jgi:arylsulfatase A-like enzyme
MCLTHGPLVHTPDEPDVTEKYAKHKAMVRYTDMLVGRVVAKLDELGVRNNTIIIFTTDNGSGGGITGTRNGHKVKGGKGKKSEAGVCAPFIVNCPGLVPAGVTTDALTDFTDLLPTFVELAGAGLPKELKIDGVSIAPLLVGVADNSQRDWIMALGHGPAKLDEQGVRGQHDYASRVIRDKRYKVCVDTGRTITELYDLKVDPWEEKNLIASTDVAHADARRKFQKIVDSMPARDARPKYRPRARQPWERPLKGN